MNINDLRALANVVKNENLPNANTAERVGTLFANIVESIKDLEILIEENNAQGNYSFSTSSTPPVNPLLGDEWLVEGVKYTWVGAWVEF